MIRQRMKTFVFVFVACSSCVLKTDAFTNNNQFPLSTSLQSRNLLEPSSELLKLNNHFPARKCELYTREQSGSAFVTRPKHYFTTSLASTSSDNDSEDDLSFDGPLDSTTSSDNDGGNDLFFDLQTTILLVGGQSLLILAAVAVAAFFGTPNYGFGPDISFAPEALRKGVLYTAPLFLLAYVLDTIQDDFPALQDVNKATQRSVIALLGGTFKPTLALVTSFALGLAAGFGEEMLFRGVCQFELAERFGMGIALGASSIVFGALHAVTPLYAVLATVASVYFGYLYIDAGNLAVPIITHALYDVGALCWAHYTVTKMMSPAERQAVAEWQGPTNDKKIDVL